MSDTEAVKRAIVTALQSVAEPNSGRDVISLGLPRGIAFEQGVARISYELPPQLGQPQVQQALLDQTRAALRALDEVRDVEVDIKVIDRRPTNTLPGVKNVIAIGAGKGGVGKSTAAVLAAVGLRRMGLNVGLLDADVYGPSIPKLTGTEGAEPELTDNGRVIPPEFDGIRVISMGYLVTSDQAVIWRGPMAQKYIKEFLDRGEWGELDYLIVDLPPGTGDIPLTLAQAIPLTGAVIVCTPQDVALLDAVKALRMYEKLGVQPLGMLENMSYYVIPGTDQREYIFGQGGVEQTAQRLNVPFLGGIPLVKQLREYGDAGRPAAAFTETEAYVVSALEGFVERLHEQVQAQGRKRTPLPQLRVSG